MLQACGYRAAVANAIDTLKREADVVTRGRQGDGIDVFAVITEGHFGLAEADGVFSGCDAIEFF